MRFDQCSSKLAAALPHRTLLTVAVAGVHYVRSHSGWLPSYAGFVTQRPAIYGGIPTTSI
eukprot:COSAG06_NODE_63732_length_261_cov_0.962963_1_plen_59_part_01